MDAYTVLHKISRKTDRIGTTENAAAGMRQDQKNQQTRKPRLLGTPVPFCAAALLFVLGILCFSPSKAQAQVLIYDGDYDDTEVTSRTLDASGMPVYVKKQQGLRGVQKIGPEIPVTEGAIVKKYNQDMVKKLTQKEIGILERIVEAEATGEDIYGKILVANVVLNRVNSKQFPDTVEKVVFQKGQFSPIQDGRYDCVIITKETKESVIRALNGEDYSDGALYFFARKKTTSAKAAWFDNTLVKLFQYQGHDFFKERE